MTASGISLLRSRIGDKTAERPLFRDDTAAHELLAQRIRYYKTADVTIDVREEETPAEIVERLILELPKGFLESAKRAIEAFMTIRSPVDFETPELDEEPPSAGPPPLPKTEAKAPPAKPAPPRPTTRETRPPPSRA